MLLFWCCCMLMGNYFDSCRSKCAASLPTSCLPDWASPRTVPPPGQYPPPDQKYPPTAQYNQQQAVSWIYPWDLLWVHRTLVLNLGAYPNSNFLECDCGDCTTRCHEACTYSQSDACSWLPETHHSRHVGLLHLWWCASDLPRASARASRFSSNIFNGSILKFII